jgi:CRISPR-associated protein Cas2
MKRRLYLVAYDISHPARLRAALHCVRNWATGGQLSVHECWLTAGELRELRRRMRRIINPREDSLLIIRLDPRQKPVTLGVAIPPQDPDWFYAG